MISIIYAVFELFFHIQQLPTINNTILSIEADFCQQYRNRPIHLLVELTNLSPSSSSSSSSSPSSSSFIVIIIITVSLTLVLSCRVSCGQIVLKGLMLNMPPAAAAL